MADYYASIPTYIPQVQLGFDYPAYRPATSELARSRSNRVVYADDPWNSASNPELFTPQRRQASDRAQQPRRLTKRPTPPSITSIFPPEDKSRREQMTSSYRDLPPSLRPGASPSSYPSTAPPLQLTFSTKAERKLSFQSTSSGDSPVSTSPIQPKKPSNDTPKPRPNTLQPTSVATARPRVSPPPSPTPAGAGMPATLVPGSRFSSNLDSIDIWADIRSTLDHPAPKPRIQRRPVIRLNQPQEVSAPRPRPQQAPVAQPTELPGPSSRQVVSPPRTQRRERPTSAPADGSITRQKTRFDGDWVVVPASRPASMPSLSEESRRSVSNPLPPTIPQLQLGAPFPVLINKRISHIQREEGATKKPLQLPPAPEPIATPSRAPPVRKSSIEPPLDVPFHETVPSVAPLAVARQPSRKESLHPPASQPASRSNTIFFAESAQLTPSPSLTAAIQSVTEEMSVNLSEPSETGSAVHWDVVDTVLKRHGAGRRPSLPEVMMPRSLRLTSDSVESVDECLGCGPVSGVCGHVERVVDHTGYESPEDHDFFDEDHSDSESDIDDLLAAWDEEDRTASPTKIVSAAVKRLREEKYQQDQLWNDVKGLLSSRGRQGSCETTTTLSSLDAEVYSPTSNYSH